MLFITIWITNVNEKVVLQLSSSRRLLNAGHVWPLVVMHFKVPQSGAQCVPWTLLLGADQSSVSSAATPTNIIPPQEHRGGRRRTRTSWPRVTPLYLSPQSKAATSIWGDWGASCLCVGPLAGVTGATRDFDLRMIVINLLQRENVSLWQK